ncbi:MAG TPA: ATP-grasp domain-containing protein [Vicinamibacteria bacterium]|nr:ATP-grasp domain-containing protein [Vicinamibacteria bacterium]
MSTPRLVLVESNTSGTGRLFVRLARRLGLEPLLLATEPSRYAFVAEEAVDAIRIDTADRRPLLTLCRRLLSDGGLAGVLSSSDHYVAMAAHLAARLGLPGPRPLAVRRCRDKFRQRRRLHAAGVAVPAFREALTPTEAVEAARTIGSSVVVKPVRGTGSVGVRLCRGASDVREHAEALLGQRSNERGLPVASRILVEEYVSGPEYSIETFDGSIVGVTRKLLGPEPRFVEVGHDHPAPIAGSERESLEAHVRRGLVALGLGFGAAHVEVRVSPHGPRTIEVNPRLAGGFIPELVRLASGVDLVAASIARATARPPPEDVAGHGAASIRFLIPPRAGVLVDATGIEAARSLPGVVEAVLYRPPGQRVVLHGDFRDRIGHVITVAVDADASAAAAAHALREVLLLVDGAAALAEAVA